MSAVTILTSGAQAASGASDSFDASSFSTLRLDLTATADMGADPYLTLYIETAAASTGPWVVMQELHMEPRNWAPKTRITLAGFDSFVRLRWAGGIKNQSPSPFGAHAGEAQPDITPSFTIGLAGDGQPDAA